MCIYHQKLFKVCFAQELIELDRGKTEKNKQKKNNTVFNTKRYYGKTFLIM